MSVGHVARAFENAGIPTVVIAVKSFENRMRSMALPRVLLTRELVGRPMGRPFDKDRQTRVLTAALELLETTTKNGMVKEI
jgi:hypothetical protein